MAIELGYEPRPQFIPFHQSTKRWSVVIAHRRSGKTYALLYHLIMSALYIPNGRFGYCAPFYSQAKAIAFDYLLRFTQNIRKSVNVAELYVELHNGARIRLYGAGNQGGDQIRGQFFHGIVLDEYADMPPNLFNEIIRAALVDHSGFCVFGGTPKGHNHLYSVYKTAQQYPDLWYSQVLKASESGIVSDEELQAAKLQMDDYQYQQEFECNFDSAIQGAYYAQQLDEMVSEGRIANFSHDVYHCVHAALDIGITDATAITFFQYRDGRFDFLDYEEGNGQIAAYWAQLIEDRARKSGWKLGYVFLPHDARAKELTSGKSVLESFVEVIGINRAQIVQNHYVSDGINGVRMALMTARINEAKCERLIDALRCYSHEWDSEKRIFKTSPRHDEYSHCFIGETAIDTPNGPKRIDQLGCGDIVSTPGGSQRIGRSFSKLAHVVELIFNTTKIVCTPDHPFITARGIVRADALRYDDIFYENPWADQVNTQSKNLTELGFITNLKAITRPITGVIKESRCTAMFGNFIMAPLKMACTFITRMATKAITELKTWKCLRQVSTSLNTLQEKSTTLAPRKKLQKFGTQVWWEDNGMQSMPSSPGMGAALQRSHAIAAVNYLILRLAHFVMDMGFVATPVKVNFVANQGLMTTPANASSAAKTLWQTNTKKAKLVPKLVQINYLQTPKMVFDMTLESEHVYYANGILVHNCADSLRYAIMGFNKKAHTDETKFFPYHQKEALRQAQAAIAQSQRKPPQDPRDLANYYSANVQRAYEKVRNSGCQDAQDYMDSYVMSEEEFCKIHGILPSHLYLLKVDPQ